MPVDARTDKDARTLTRQLVCHSHGARDIFVRHAADDKADVTVWQARAAVREATAATAAAADLQKSASDASSAADQATAAAGAAAAVSAAAVETATVASEGVSAAATEAAAAAAAVTAEERAKKQKMQVCNVGRVSVVDVARRPDFANIGALLNLASTRHVRVATRTPILARFECGTRAQQQLRAADDYVGLQWHNVVLYHPGGDDSKLCIGELRAIARGPKGDAVV